ncbi:MAG: Ribosomal protein [Candidatus Saccharibacteria bacterium]|jgi:large subunit ribosomal protein L23|nr:Ribosomal protein [Candidatus Saccharibacteria bacterium]
MSQLLLTPKISEKAIYLAERGIYVFEVPTDTNKIEVAKAVEATFKVNVTDVNIVIHKGKLKRFKQKLGRQKDTKKAMVKLKSGQSIALFEGAK